MVRENRVCVCAFLVEIQLIMVVFCFRLSLAGSMCMTGAKCESDSVGVKKCVASAVKPVGSDAMRSASLAVVVVVVTTLASMILM